MTSVPKNFLLATTTGLLLASAALAAPAAVPPPTDAPGYANLVDLAVAAPTVLIATVARAVPLKGADAAGVAPGRVRLYVEGTVDALLTGANGVPGSVNWLADMPLTSANRPPKLKRQRVILLARPAPGGAGALQLVSKDAQLPWTADTERRLRAILAETTSRTAAPAIAGIGHAFHVAGSIPGEGETQIFLKTADGRPVSLSVLRRPGEAPRWSVSLGEIVDDTATAPPRDTLLWYRLACGLPATLPDEAVADQQPDDAAQAREDYAVVVRSLGPCGRTGGDATVTPQTR